VPKQPGLVSLLRTDLGLTSSLSAFGILILKMLLRTDFSGDAPIEKIVVASHLSAAKDVRTDAA